MIIHSTVITQRATVKLTRQEIRPTDHPFVLLSCIASPRPSIPPSFSSTLPLPLENLEAANLPPVICKPPPPPSPRASHKLTELYYADPLLSLSRPPFLLQIYYIPTSVQPPSPRSTSRHFCFAVFASIVETRPSFSFFSKSWKREDFIILLFEGLF